MSRLTYSEVTPKADFLNRRQIMAGAAGLGGLAFLGGAAQAKTLDF
ncbi:MAG: mononuclear molybdenum enzyme YedY, partial [Rhodobacteraceae bacterium]